MDVKPEQEESSLGSRHVWEKEDRSIETDFHIHGRKLALFRNCRCTHLADADVGPLLAWGQTAHNSRVYFHVFRNAICCHLSFWSVWHSRLISSQVSKRKPASDSPSSKRSVVFAVRWERRAHARRPRPAAARALRWRSRGRGKQSPSIAIGKYETMIVSGRTD